MKINYITGPIGSGKTAALDAIAHYAAARKSITPEQIMRIEGSLLSANAIAKAAKGRDIRLVLIDDSKINHLDVARLSDRPEFRNAIFYVTERT